MKRTLLHDLTLVTGNETFRGDIIICGDRIEKIIRTNENGLATPAGTEMPLDEVEKVFLEQHPDGEVIRLTGLLAFAGGIDAHVHFREPGMTAKADIGSESKAALLGGVTSFIDMPNVNPPTTTAERLYAKLALASGRSWANFGFHIGATADNAEEIAKIPSEDFGGIKIFMGSSTGNMLLDDDGALSSFFRTTRKEILVHSEDERTIRRNMEAAIEKYGEDIPFRLHAEIRSRQACIKSTVKALELAMSLGTRLHVLHLSTAEEAEMIKAAKRINPKITAETSANYLWFSSEDYDRLGSRIKCNPSVKGAGDRAALRAALKSGVIDTIGSDHAPHLATEKARPYLQAPSGLPSIRQTLSVLLSVAEEEDIPLTRIAEAFSENTARIFGIRERGVLKEGCFADIVTVDPHKEYVVKNDDCGYRCGWTPYEDVKLKGTVEHVFINGEMKVKDGKLTDDIPSGRRLRFEA